MHCAGNLQGWEYLRRARQPWTTSFEYELWPLLGIVLKSQCQTYRARLVVVVAAVDLLLVVWAIVTNILVEYEEWIRRGMPERHTSLGLTKSWITTYPLPLTRSYADDAGWRSLRQLGRLPCWPINGRVRQRLSFAAPIPDSRVTTASAITSS
ncbi:hypothetical protein RSK60_190009 [Ralstonia solanacearum K60]|nr:hypothetical protein RSK60_190009 [Ralstonia solanacearum K60]